MYPVDEQQPLMFPHILFKVRLVFEDLVLDLADIVLGELSLQVLDHGLELIWEHAPGGAGQVTGQGHIQDGDRCGRDEHVMCAQHTVLYGVQARHMVTPPGVLQWR